MDRASHRRRRSRIAVLPALLTLLVGLHAPAGAQDRDDSTAAAGAAAPVVEGAGAPAPSLPRIEAAVEVDAVLDEPVWRDALRLGGFWQYEPVDGIPAAESTTILAWYSPDAVHFGIVADDSAPGAIRATRADRDAIGGEDHVVLYLDTFDDHRRAYFFGVNPLGVQMDGVRTEGSGGAGSTFGGSIDRSPDFLWSSAGRVTDRGWVAELRIPFESLNLPTSEPQSWGFQALRVVQRTGHTYTWTDADQAAASFLLQSGGLSGIDDFERGVTLEAQPFITAGLNGRLEPEGRFERDDVDPEVGVNLHAGFGAASLDATVNPDFSQVEADAGQVTVNERFALFVPEKRPFFLEGIELFSTPNQLVYTRRIVDPSVGAKITGKQGRLGYAALSALDESSDVGPFALSLRPNDALFNIGRLRADFASNSVAGLVYTDRTELDDSPYYNRVAAADVRHVFGGMYFLQAQYGQSWTRDGDGSDRGQIWHLELDRTGHLFGLNYRLSGTSEDFSAQAGFVNRTGIINGNILNRFRWYGDPGELLETFTVFFGPERIWEYGGSFSDPVEGGEYVNLNARLRGGWNAQANIRRNFALLDPEEYAALFIDDGVGGTLPYEPLPEVTGPYVSLSASTPVYQTFEAGVEATHSGVPLFAEGSEGVMTRASAEIALRPRRWLRIGSGLVYERLERERDGSEFARTLIPRLRAEVQPSRPLFFRAIAEWRAEERAALRDARTGEPLLDASGTPIPASAAEGLRIDLLASYQPTPGTVAFLGYGATLAGDQAFAYDPDRLARIEDGFFLKLAYRFRR